MSEENRTSTRQFVEVGDVHHSDESASEGEENLQSQLLDRRLFSTEVDWRINAIVALQPHRNVNGVSERT